MRFAKPLCRRHPPPSGPATLSIADGRVVMPTETAYERELFEEVIRHAARHREQLELRVGSCTWLVGVRNRTLSARCRRCGMVVDSLDRVLRH
jgi:hypothetical protein